MNITLGVLATVLSDKAIHVRYYGYEEFKDNVTTRDLTACVINIDVLNDEFYLTIERR